jgi:hypothetical protein
VKEVIDRGPLMMEGTDFYCDVDEDLRGKHKFKTWRGKIDDVQVFIARHDWNLL